MSQYDDTVSLADAGWPGIRNLSLFAGPLTNVEGEFAIEGQAEGWKFAIYANGEGIGFANAGELFATHPLGVGAADLEILPMHENEFNPPPWWGGEPNGSRVILIWTKSTATDLGSYQVFWDNATGTVSYDSPLMTVDQVESARRLRALPDSGTGTGRLTIGGVYRGSTANAIWKIKITGAGTFQYDIGAGYNGTDLEFFAGLPVSLSQGVTVTFLDAVANYDTNDVWTWSLGVRSWAITDALDAGTYKFAVKGVDIAGNASTASSELTVTVTPKPAAPSDASASWDPSAAEITLTWTDATGTDSVNIYSNWDKVFSRLESYVMEDSPVASIAADTETAVIDLSPAASTDVGAVYFYIRTVDSSGIESDNATLLSVDALAEVVPSTSAPFALVGTPAPGGSITLAWMIRLELSETAPSSFNIYQFDDEPTSEADWDTLAASQSWASGSGIGVRSFSKTFAISGSPTWFGVRSVLTTELRSDTYIQVTADSSAPSQVSGFLGGAG